MVRLLPVNSDGTEEDIQMSEEAEKLLREAGPGMVSAVASAEDCFRKMNVDPEVVSPEASRVLISVREGVVFRVMLFKSLLPLSQKVVQDVQSILRRYFINSSREDFKTSRSLLETKLKRSAKSAKVANMKYQLLATEFKNYFDAGSGEISDAENLLKQKKQSMEEAATASKDAAELRGTLGTAASCASFFGSLFYAKGLLTIGGAVAAFPPLAPVVVLGGLVGSGMISEKFSKSVTKHESNERKSLDICGQVSTTLETLRSMTVGVLRFADCSQACANFFANVESQLKALADNEEVDEDTTDKELEVLLSKVSGEAGQLMQACMQYEQFANQVETRIRSLDQYKPKDCSRLVDVWIESTDDWVKSQVGVNTGSS